MKRRRQRGLTLVELLVVIVILALASSVVLLNAPPSRPDVREDAERFAARLSLAFDETIATGRAMRLAIDASGYRFETREDDAWSPLEGDKALGPRPFDARSTAKLEMADAADDNTEALGGDARDETADEEARRILLDPLGAQAAFSVRFSSADGAWLVTVTDGAAIEVKEDA